MLLVITGVRGAGKTTLRDRLHQGNHAVVLQPSTTRAPRSEDDTEYEFVTDWEPENYAWTITVGGNKYGFRRSEIDRAYFETCVAVFEPTNLNVLREYAASQGFETVIIGLDTVASLEDQLERVGNDTSRLMDADDFVVARNAVAETDLVLTGSADRVLTAAIAAIGLLSGRGGVLTREAVEPLMAAGALVTGGRADALRHASYDLHIGRQVWSNRTLLNLDENQPTFEIAPYSYAIVTAEEEANLPTFVTATFDIKVSLFLRGVVLSNGPQIDPGYKGQLFCMLFNGSSAPITLSVGSHFSTLEFSTAAYTTQGYRQEYHLQHRLEHIMNEGAMSGPGGNIISDVTKLFEGIDTRLSQLHNPHWPAILTILGVALAIAFVPVAWSFTLVDQAKTLVEEARRLTGQIEAPADLLHADPSPEPNPSPELEMPEVSSGGAVGDADSGEES